MRSHHVGAPQNPLWERREAFGPHPGYLGGLVTEQPILLREPNLIAFVTAIRCFPMAVLFTVSVEQTADDGSLMYDEHEPPEVTVGFADGRQWSNQQGAVRLQQRSSGSSRGDGGATWTADYWLPAVPPEGAVSFAVCVGDREGQASLPSDLLVEAAHHAVDLWDG